MGPVVATFYLTNFLATDRLGTIVDWNESTGRWNVRLDLDGSTKALKTENLLLAPEEIEKQKEAQRRAVRHHPLPELSSEFFRQQESSVHISEMSQKCCLYAHFGGLTGPALRDVILDEV